MFNDATGGHASVDVQCDHDIVHSWGRSDVGACSVLVHRDLPLLTAFFLPVPPPPPHTSSALAQMTTQELLLCEYRPPFILILHSGPV